MRIVRNVTYMTVKIQLIVNYNTKITRFIRLAQLIACNRIYRITSSTAALITYSLHSAFVKSYPHLPFINPFLEFATHNM